MKQILSKREDFSITENQLKEIKELKAELLRSRKNEATVKLQISELQQQLKSFVTRPRPSDSHVQHA